jgi:pantoate--beta-alanine ligase
MIEILRSPQALRDWRAQQQNSVGFVPTMGALHAGHSELLHQARKINKTVLLSIFVNPTQFNDPKDLEKYPKTWEADLALAQKQGVDAIFYPQYEDMYADQYRFKVSENKFSLLLDGAHRPGHFDGVLSVVLKLFMLAQPTRAYFGEKDFQQLSLIQGMVQSFFLPVEIIPIPTVREEDGLAMSSRNTRLTAEERARAPLIYKTITSAQSASDAAETLRQSGFIVDYVEDQNGRRFVAARIGSVRLIDNVRI